MFQDSCHSTSEFCVILSENLISWPSKRQSALSTSNVEAKYMAIVDVDVEASLKLHALMRLATMVFCDNIATIQLLGNLAQ